MKSLFTKGLLSFAVVAALLPLGAMARDIQPSELPAGVTDFVKTYYPEAKIVDAESDKKGYDIELSNGVDLDFDRSGQIIKVDADHAAIDAAVLKAILPAAAYNSLKNDKQLNSVEEVERKRSYYEVELIPYGKLRFSVTTGEKIAR